MGQEFYANSWNFVYGEFYGNFGILGETFSILFLLGEFQGNK
jgi:hypothetical protein